MGEGTDDLIQVAKALRRLEVASLPVNFFLPISGTRLTETPTLTPDYCLRVLCLYRFLNPRAEIRIAAGREHHLRSMEVMALYPANSMFIEGYLNATGTATSRTLQMIEDAGFTVETNAESAAQLKQHEKKKGDVLLKELKVLRPRIESNT
jgi:biotin synthase